MCPVPSGIVSLPIAEIVAQDLAIINNEDGHGLSHAPGRRCGPPFGVARRRRLSNKAALRDRSLCLFFGFGVAFVAVQLRQLR